MNSLDIFILIPIVLGFVLGLFRGLVKEIASLAAIVLGIYIAKFFSPTVSQWLIDIFNLSVSIAKPAAYLLLFVAFAVALLIVVRLIDKLLSAIALGGLNKILGAFFGTVKFALIVSVLLNVFSMFDGYFSLLDKEERDTSIIYKPLMKLAPVLWNEALKENIDEKTVVPKNAEESI